MPDPTRKTSPSHGFALAWPMPCGGQEEVRESGCLLFAGAEMGQNPGSEETKALKPNSTPAPLSRIFPFPTQFLQMTRAALPHHHAQRDPALCSSPRSGNASSATPVKARQTSGSEVGMGTAPSGAPSSPTTSAISSTYFRLAARFKHGFLVLRPLPANTCQKMIACKAKQVNCPTGRNPK